ncbi:MAG: putative bifunctional diguanylate cyclase/phosphodiesterase [Nitriliruptorales bacterium]
MRTISTEAAAGERDRLMRLQRTVLVAYVLLTAIALLVPSSRDLLVNLTAHAPFIVVLSLACAVAARAAWTRFHLDGTSRSFLLTAAFAGLALVFFPHAFAGFGGPYDEAYAAFLVFDPASRLLFALVLVAAMANVPVPRLLRRPRSALVLLAALIAGIVDVATHASWVTSLAGGDLRRLVVVLEVVAMAANLAVVGLVVRHLRRRRGGPFLVTIALVSTTMLVAGVLYLAGPAWSWLWWIAHLGLLVAAAIIFFGISQQIVRAIGTDELVLHYQPKIELRSDRVVGVEVLARWHHPDRGLVPPASFIPLIELSDLNRPFTSWVLGTALAQQRLWREDGLDLPVAVNLSPRLLLEPEIVDIIRGEIERHGTDPADLELELTETAFTADEERVLQVAGELRSLGVRLSIDDFGTGYSSLAFLRHLPVQEVKIDKSFVADIGTHDSDRIIVESTIRLSHELGHEVVAEGVEDEATRDQLAALGCDVGQGYLWSRPLPSDELVTWVRAREPVVPASPVGPA